MIIFDADDDCPRELAPTIEGWANDESPHVPCAVVMANREYEAWFLASIESLRGRRGIREDAESHPDPEAPRAAKAQREERMIEGASYSETIDQPALTALFDMRPTHVSCRSFRRLIRVFGLFADALGHAVVNWPPLEWQEEA